MIFQGRRHRVEPVRAAQVIFEIVAGRDGVDSKLNDVQTRIGGELHLTQDLLGIIRVFRKNQDKRATLLDGAGNFAGIRAARHDIARRDPARYAIRFKICAESFRDRKISGGMTDEDDSFHQQ